jgi:hypothetical protein
MANAVFTPAREGILDDTISLSVGIIKAVLVRGYTYAASHKFVSDVTATGVLAGTPQTLGTKTYVGGVFDAADVTFTAVPANASNHAVLIYQASAVTGGADVAATAQRVIGYYDTGTLLPVVPNGGDITVAWDNGANKIFAIA